MDNRQLLSDFQNAINKIYNEQGLTCLRGLDASYTLNGRQLLMWHSDTVRKPAIKYKGHFDYHKNLDDIFFCSDELLYFTGHLYLYRQYINNPLADSFRHYDRTVYPNYQNLAAKRYSMFSDVASQSAYNYWDRIGDLIASFFPDSIKPHQVFFGTALEIIPKELHSSKNFIWLNEFKTTRYKELNNERKQIVHYTTSDTSFKYEHLDNSSDKGKMEKLQADREAIADFYKNHIAHTLEGFEKTLLLLEEVSALFFADIAQG